MQILLGFLAEPTKYLSFHQPHDDAPSATARSLWSVFVHGTLPPDVHATLQLSLSAASRNAEKS